MSNASPNDQPCQQSQLGRVARSVGLVMTLMAVAKVAGLIKQQIIAGAFGTGADYDAYQAALAAPELLTTLLAYSTLGLAFIPVYSALVTRQDDSEASALASSVINNVLAVTIGLSIVMAVGAPLIVRAEWGIGPGFGPEQQALTARLLRVALISSTLFAVSGILSSLLHAHQHFLTPALAPLAYDAGVVIGALALAPRMGVVGMAWGAVLGALLHMSLQLPVVIAKGVRWQPVLGWHDKMLRRVAVLMAPRLIDLTMARLSIQWINANLASRMGEGSISAIGYAYQLMNMPQTIIGTALGFVILPTLAEMAARKDVNAQRQALSGSLRAIFALAVPAAMGLLILGRPLIQILFERGEFTSESTSLVFWGLQFYALGLITHSMLEVVVRAFAAQQDTLTPLLVSFPTTVLNIGLAIWLARPVDSGGLAHGGLALANSVAVGVESIIGLTILHVRWRGIQARQMITAFGKATLAALIMGGAITAFQAFVKPPALMAILVGGSLGVVVYIGLALALGLEDIRTLLQSILNRAPSIRAAS